MVTDFSAAEKDSGVKFLHPCYYLDRSSPILEVKGQGHQGRKMPIHKASWQPGPQSVKKHLIEIAVEQSELGAAALLKAVWWELCLASLLTRLFSLLVSRFKP